METKNQSNKFCQHCGKEINADAIVCPHCGCQVNLLKSEQPNVVINNSNQNVNSNCAGVYNGKWVNKWISFLLCLFLGYLGAHKFYEGKIFMGILYFFSLGLFGLGWIIDCFAILLKPNPYFVSK